MAQRDDTRERTPVDPVVVPRWVQMVLLPLVLLGAYGLLRAAGPIALLLLVSSLIALLLNPFVSLLRRARFPRGIAVATVALSVIMVVTGIGVLVANPIADQVSALQRNVPDLVRNANAELDDFQAWLDRKEIDVQVKEPGQSALGFSGRAVRARAVVSFLA